MRNITLLVDPIEITLGAEQTLPDGIKVIKPNVGAEITSLKKKNDAVTNYSSTYTRAFTTDNMFYIGCAGDTTWDKIAGTGTVVCLK